MSFEVASTHIVVHCYLWQIFFELLLNWWYSQQNGLTSLTITQERRDETNFHILTNILAFINLFCKVGDSCIVARNPINPDNIKSFFRNDITAQFDQIGHKLNTGGTSGASHLTQRTHWAQLKGHAYAPPFWVQWHRTTAQVFQLVDNFSLPCLFIFVLIRVVSRIY